MSDCTTESTPTLNLGAFTCTWCRLTVPEYAPDGEPRNHCPSCLRSQHVHDHAAGGPGECEGEMSPIAVAVLRSGDWMVIHRCVRCDELTSSPARCDDNQLILMRLAVRPLAQPPFPLEAFGTM
ncbi:RNHCP domain-containing protein [Brevibacterium salitolerans]|uniref:RNHCP domain-containing protein n=1 Tax=Brevibacterium salitolerans TaxID=1403566 RepID=A0ABN2WR08_9MICO|nr:RNHCP domain-containing protein [Brevibacterium sp.]